MYPSILYGPKEPDVRTAWLEYKQTVPCRYHPWRIFTKFRSKKHQKKKHSTDSRALLQLLEIAAKEQDGPATSATTQKKKKEEKHSEDAEKNVKTTEK